MPVELTIRPLATDAEREHYLLLAATEFFQGTAPDQLPAAARNWGAYLQSLPEYRPEQIRGVFAGETLLAGCIVYERVMRLGAALLPTACIGAVVTDPAHRQRGAGRVLLDGAVAFAQAEKHALLLLDGIPNFYHRFGFVDVFDWTEFGIDPRDALDLPASDCQTRPATLEDGPALLALYLRHLGDQNGGFTRTLDQQMLRLRRRIAENPPIVAVDQAGAVVGYANFVTGEHPEYCMEAAADIWPAALALVQYHARMITGMPNAAPRLWWHTPPQRPLAYWLADHIAARHPEYWPLNPLLPYAIRAQTYYNPDCDWMARPAAMQSLAQAMLPEWQAQLNRYRLGWTGSLALYIGEDVIALTYDGDRLALATDAPPDIGGATLTPQVFTQLLFGYRPVTWAQSQPGCVIPADLAPILAALFPPRDVWIASSDRF